MSLYKNHFTTLFKKAKLFLNHYNLDSLVIGAGEQTFVYADDQHMPWKMPACLRHFIYEDVGPHAFLVITNHIITAYIFQPDDYWYAPPKLPKGEWTHHIIVKSFNQLETLKAALSALNLTNAIYVGPCDSKINLSIQAASDIQLRHINEWRVHKSDFEIACIKAANISAAKGHIAAKESFDEGVSEFDIHLDYLSMTSQAEEEVPYHNIIAMNEHASILHYQYLARDIPDNLQTFLIDAGSTCNGYASDITRTHVGANIQSDAFMAIVEGLRHIKLSVIEKCIKGTSWLEIQSLTHALIAHLLVHIGVIQNLTPQAAYEKGMTKIFYPHGIGHFLGLQVHDVAGFQNSDGSKLERDQNHPSLRVVRELEVGMVMTVEPGIYFIPSLLESARKNPDQAIYLNETLIQTLMPFGGARDEDNIVITEGAPRNLTAEAFAEIEWDGF